MSDVKKNGGSPEQDPKNKTVDSDRKLFKKSDGIILIALLLFCVCAFIFTRRSTSTDENYAVLSIDNKIVATYYLGDFREHSTIDLATEKNYSFPGKLEFDSGKVRFADVACPDKICEKVGYVKNEGQSIICLPNKTSLSIYTPQEYQNLKK